MSPSSEIPASLAPFFQEYRFETLDRVRHGELIIERVLNFGTRAEVRWLIAVYGLDTIRTWLESPGLRRLARRRRVLWFTIFDIDESKVDLRSTGIWLH